MAVIETALKYLLATGMFRSSEFSSDLKWLNLHRLYCLTLSLLRATIRGKDAWKDFTKNLTRYRFENNFIELSK